jgi:Skp family chaperone for outer membrane proteins
MKTLVKSAALASSLVLANIAVQPAVAQDKGGTIVQGLAVASFDAVIANSNAYKSAEQQRQTTYKAQYDQAKSRSEALNAQLKPLVDKFNADRRAAKPNQASLQQQAQQIQQIQENGQREIQQILAPVAMSQAYVNEQIEDKLDAAVKAAMNKKKVSLLLSPEAVLAVNGSAYNLNQEILSELNTALPSAQIVPPSGWEPRQIREARAQQSAAQTQTQTAAPTTGTQPTGR